MNIIETEEFDVVRQGHYHTGRIQWFPEAKPTVDVQWHSRCSEVTPRNPHGYVLNAIFLSKERAVPWTGIGEQEGRLINYVGFSGDFEKKEK